MPSTRILVTDSGKRGPQGDPGDPGVTTTVVTGGVASVVAGTGISVNNTDPGNPVVSATGAASGDPAATTHAATSKTTLVDADEVPIANSASSYVLGKALMSNVWAYIQTKMNAAGVAKLATARTINSVSFDGTGNVSNRLDQLAAPTASVSMGSQKITSLLAGTASTDAANKAQVDAVANSVLRFVVWDGTGSTPARPVTAAGNPVLWFSPVQPAGGGTVGGGTGSVNGLDYWMKTV